jgi:hypothetical protein
MEASAPEDPIAVAMLANPGFAGPEQLVAQAHHGLPLRLKWQLLVVVLGWRCDKTAAAAETLSCLVELGENGHYASLATPARPAEECAFGGEEGEWPRQVMTSYHARSDKLRVALRRGDGGEVGYCRMQLRDLSPGKPLVGWVKVKSEGRDAKGHRTAVGSVRVGLLLSASQKAEVLFLIDTRQHEVLYYQEVETLVDLNPVFAQHSMVPFRWKSERDLAFVSNAQQLVVASLQLTRLADEGVVGIVLPQEEPYWQCSLTRTTAGVFSVEGCWQGRVREYAKSRAIVELTIEAADGAVVARGEWRNARDLKLSVDVPSQDPIVPIALLIGVAMLKNVEK